MQIVVGQSHLGGCTLSNSKFGVDKHKNGVCVCVKERERERERERESIQET